MSWVDAAKTVRGAWQFAKKRRKPRRAEPKASPPQVDRMLRSAVDLAAERMAQRTREMRRAKSPIADMIEKDPLRAITASMVGKMTDEEKDAARETMYRVASEAYGNGDMSWDEFKAYKKAHDRAIKVNIGGATTVYRDEEMR